MRTELWVCDVCDVDIKCDDGEPVNRVRANLMVNGELVKELGFSDGLDCCVSCCENIITGLRSVLVAIKRTRALA